jgi:hypothetical protein
MEIKMTTIYVRDIDFPGLMFSNDSNDVEYLRDLTNTRYDSYFMQTSENGEIVAIYGMYGIVPLLEKQVYEIEVKGL